MRFFLPVFAMILLGLHVAGCGRSSGPEIAPVRGVVTLDGAPLVNAQVNFNPTEGGRASTGVTNDQGEFELIYTHDRSGALLGQHQVTIQSAEFAGEGAADPKVPEKYNKKSELVAEVKAKGNQFEFPLESLQKSTARK